METSERLITFLLETPMFEKLDPSEIQKSFILLR